MREGWVETTLGEIAKWSSGGTPRAGESIYYGGDIPWCVIGDLNEGEVVETAAKITELGLQNSSAKIVDPGAVLVAMYGASIGRTGMAGCRMATNQAIASAITFPNLADNDFLLQFLQSQKSAFVDAGQGAAQANISQTVLKSWPILLPPLAEQRRIVDVIESVDNYITALETRAETLSELSGSLVAAIFQSPESKVVSLSSLCEAGGIQIGPFGSQLHASDYVPFGVPSVMPRDLTRNGFDTSSLSYVSEKKASELSKHQVAPGDILFARRGDLSKRALVTDSEAGWLCGTGTVRVRLTGIKPRLAFFALTTPEVNSWLTDHAVGATMPNLNSQIIANIPVRIPANPELAIAAIEMTNKACGELTNTLATSKRLRTALLSDLLSGNHEIPASYDQLLGAA
jgi:type I restriction enzyme S subunit